MSYEEYVNEEAMELTEEAVEEAVDTAVEEAAAEELDIQFSVEEPLTEPTVDEELFDVSADEEFEMDMEIEEEQAVPCNPLQAKCDELRNACKDVVARLSSDLEQTDYNPYIRSTTTYRYEILKKSTDTEPVDVFEFQRTSGFSLRAMAITSVLVAAADVAVGKLIKKKLLKK